MNLSLPLSDLSDRVLKMYAGRLARLNIVTIADLLFHVPFRYDDYSLVSKIGMLQAGEIVTVQGRIVDISSIYTRSRKTMQKATVADDTGSIDVTWFNQPFLTKQIAKGSFVSLSGKVDLFKYKNVLQSPDYEVIQDESSPQTLHTGRLVPIYPETKGVSSKWLRRKIATFLSNQSLVIEDYLPESIRQEYHFDDLQTALNKVHFPMRLGEADRAKQRLGFDEFFLMQLKARERKESWTRRLRGNPFAIAIYKKKLDAFLASLPFTLTKAQERAVQQITQDLVSDRPMNRLLEGDVGSGKTVVSAIAMYIAYLNGFESIMMAPTEILAQQHYNTISNLLTPFEVKVELVTGSKKPRIRNQESGIKAKKNSLDDSSFMIYNSNFDILVGTHALLNKSIKLKNLGLVVIDEQQRFGVEQRSIIRDKGKNPHLLTMTATPIPRTVALTMYGDLDLSYLDEMPKGRKIVKTWLVPKEKRDPGYEWIRKQIKDTSSQAFIICPLIEESENMQTVKAATIEYERLKKDVFPDLSVGLLHGRMKGKEKDEALQKFRKGENHILVATPVVEVGIDIPNATIIVIEAAERFGLSQLHQLRGRVGRSDKQSFCLLFTDSESTTAIRRLKAMETSHNGAELAEFDLKLRGPGDMFGTMQHGRFKLKVASFSDFPLIEKAKYAVEKIFPKLDDYPKLKEKLQAMILTNVSPD